jgi:hypothetical protein
MSEDGYRNLADAIIMQAVHDYRRSVKLLIRKPYSAKAHHDKQEVETFFRGGWFQVLCNLDGQELLKKLEAGVRK